MKSYNILSGKRLISQKIFKTFCFEVELLDSLRRKKNMQKYTGFLKKHNIYILLVAWLYSHVNISSILYGLSLWGHLPHGKTHCLSPCWQQYENYLWRRCTELGSDTFLQQKKKTKKPSIRLQSHQVSCSISVLLNYNKSSKPILFHFCQATHSQTSFLKSIFSHFLEVLNACKGTIIVLGKVQFDERFCFQFLGSEKIKKTLSLIIRFTTPTNTTQHIKMPAV